MLFWRVSINTNYSILVYALHFVVATKVNVSFKKIEVSLMKPLKNNKIYVIVNSIAIGVPPSRTAPPTIVAAVVVTPVIVSPV